SGRRRGECTFVRSPFAGRNLAFTLEKQYNIIVPPPKDRTGLGGILFEKGNGRDNADLALGRYRNERELWSK
ncbi:MAG TPA: hypothetical protein H9896_00915, partial [Candidatus Pygmaiobacter gallistercoris]|nr:hypothetical protein [Candidatus Pygmaiobacter gallistercoris]